MSESNTTTTSTIDAPSPGATSAPPTESAAPSASPSGNAAEIGTQAPGQPPAPTPPAKQDAPPTSLTPPKSVASTAQPTGTPPTVAPDVEELRRQRAANSELGRERQRLNAELETMRKQNLELQQFREEQTRKAQQANLKRWDARHPENSKFNALREKASVVRQQLHDARNGPLPDGLPPEHERAYRARAEAIALSAMSDDERKELEAYQQETQAQQHQLLSNPVSFMAQHVVPMIRQEVQQMIADQRAAAEVRRDQEDPELGPLIETHRADIARALSEGVPYEQAIHYTKIFGAAQALQAENARLKQQMAEMTGKVSAADVQTQLAKGKASITRDVGAPKPQPFRKALEWARANNVDTDSDAFRAKVRQFTETAST